MYFIRMSFKWKDEHLHDNRLRSSGGAPGRDSIHKQEIVHIYCNIPHTNKGMHNPSASHKPAR